MGRLWGNRGFPGWEEISGLYNASLDDVELRTGDSPLELKIYSRRQGGQLAFGPASGLIAVSTLSPRTGELLGESVLKGCPLSAPCFEDLQHIGLNLGTGRKRPVRRYPPETETSAPIL